MSYLDKEKQLSSIRAGADPSLAWLSQTKDGQRKQSQGRCGNRRPRNQANNFYCRLCHKCDMPKRYTLVTTLVTNSAPSCPPMTDKGWQKATDLQILKPFPETPIQRRKIKLMTMQGNLVMMMKTYPTPR